MGLDVNIKKKEEGAFIVSIAGSLDSETYMDCEKKLEPLMSQQIKVLVLNLEGLDYISSAGLGIVFKTKQAVEKKGGNLVIANLKPNVKMIFDAVKVISEKVFATLDGVDEYLDSYIAHINAQGAQSQKENLPKK